MSFPGTIAAESPDAPAVIMAASGATQTYAELDEGATRLANLFASLGLEPGDHVAFCAENHLRFLELAWGATYAGLIFTAASTRLTPEELAYIVNDCGARVFISTAKLADLATAIVDHTPNVEARFLLDGTAKGHRSYEDAVAEQPAEPAADRVEGTDMLYSSGTTGQPKGVAIPFKPQPLGTKPVLSALCEGVLGFRPDMAYLSPAPLYHAAPLRYCLCVHRVGGTVVVMEHFDAQGALDAIESYSITHSQWVPTMFIRMLKLPDEVRTRYDVSSMEMMVHAAAPCPVEAKLAMLEWFGPIIHEYYAGTEGNGFVYCNAEQWLDHPGTVGQAMVGAVHILDDDGQPCPTGEPGTIWFESDAQFSYHNDPEKTANSRNDRGWSTLGDVGYLDEDGFLYLTDRQAYMIITGGVNVYPQEAENRLAMHPKVADVAVIGVPDDDFGEQVKAVVQLVNPTEATEATEQELITFCREQLADVKCPRSVDFRDELPRHPTGKLYKRLLKDEYWAGHGARRI